MLQSGDDQLVAQSRLMYLPHPKLDEAFLGNVSPVRLGGTFGGQPRGFVGVVGCYKRYNKVV